MTTDHEPTPALDDFLAAYALDDNEWWRLSSGHHLNLFDEAVDRLRAAETRRPADYDATAPIPDWPAHPADMTYAHLDRALAVVVCPDDSTPARVWVTDDVDRAAVAQVLRDLADVIGAPPGLVEVPRGV